MTTDILMTHAKFPDGGRIVGVSRKWDGMHGTVLVLDVTDIPDNAKPSENHKSSRIVLTLEEMDAILPAINKHIIAEERSRREKEGFQSLVRIRRLNPEKALLAVKAAKGGTHKLQTTVWDMEEEGEHGKI